MNMTNTKTCPICGKAVDPSRLAKHPSAVVCGGRECSMTYKRAALTRSESATATDALPASRATVSGKSRRRVSGTFWPDCVSEKHRLRESPQRARAGHLMLTYRLSVEVRQGRLDGQHGRSGWRDEDHQHSQTDLG